MTSIVGVVVVIVSVLHLARLASVSLDESRARADLLAKTIYQRAREVVGAGPDPYAALKADSGLRSILESSVYSKDVTFAAIADVSEAAVVHADPSLEGQTLPFGGDLSGLLDRSPFAQLLAIYSSQGQNLELREPLLLGDREIGSIRIGVSTLLIRQNLNGSLGPGAGDRAHRPRALGARRHAARAAPAAPHPCDPQRVDAPRQRRVRRAAEPHAARRVRRARHVLQRGQRTAVGGPLADGRAGREPRVGGRAARGRRRDRQRARRDAVREPRDPDAAAGGCARRVARRVAAAGSSAPPALRADAGQPAVARPALGGVRRQRRAARDDARHQRPEGRSRRDHADRAQPRVLERGAVDGAVLAEARRARAPVCRRGARGEEPAERDDDPPRAAAPAGLGEHPPSVRRTAREGRRGEAPTARCSQWPSRPRSIAPRRCSTST